LTIRGNDGKNMPPLQSQTGLLYHGVFIWFVWFYGVQAQYRSYGTETGKMILANLTSWGDNYENVSA
jgi:hypothetical protein